MATIDQIVNVVISLQSTAVPQVGFGIPMILGTSSVISPDLIRFYTSTDAMLEDGWLSTDAEYIHAAKAFSQAIRPTQVAIGRRNGGTMAADIAAIQAVTNGDSWYGLIITSKVKADILAAAAYIETQKKIFVACSSDSDIPTAATGDLMTALKGFSYKRTALIYTLDALNAAEGPDAAWVGGQLPQTPGASTWKFKQLVGIAPDNYTGTQRNILVGDPPAGITGKNANIYETVGGVNITEEGWMAGGQFIDITVGIDWLQAEIQTNIYALLVSNPKVPYTDAGGAALQNEITKAIKQGIANGLIDGKSPYSVTVPPVLEESSNNRAIRYLPDATFSCRFSGAYHFIKVTGTVTT